MVALIIVLIIIALLAVIVVALYNGLVNKRNQADNAWSQIDAQLQRRLDLIPNLVSTVKGYASHESGVLEKVTELRSKIISGDAPSGERFNMENQLTGALKSLFAVSESYPDLKASQNFLSLQEELSSTENKIAFARQAYNDSVTDYNNALQTFPGNIVAGLFHFEGKSLFEAQAEAKEAPKVEF